MIARRTGCAAAAGDETIGTGAVPPGGEGGCLPQASRRGRRSPVRAADPTILDDVDRRPDGLVPFLMPVQET